MPVGAAAHSLVPSKLATLSSSIWAPISSSTSTDPRSLVANSAAAGILVVVVVFFRLAMWGAARKKWDPKGQHILVTGGSQGLGLAVAELLAQRGAHVTLCARSEAKLEKAVERVKARRASPSQRIRYVASDLSHFEGARHALALAASDSSKSTRDGTAASPSDDDAADAKPSSSSLGPPTTVFCCAGGAKPGFFLEHTEEDFELGFRLDYMTALGTAHAAANLWVRSGVRDGKLVLVSSTLGLMGLVGYTQYAPMKHAIRGLAESLRSELQLYGFTVHAYFPGTILSPGFEVEQLTKPKITQELEGDPRSEGLTPEQCARGLVRGVERGHFFITTDLLSELFRSASATGGSVPANNWVLDRVKGAVALIGIPIWRIFVADRSIRAHREEHRVRLGL